MTFFSDCLKNLQRLIIWTILSKYSLDIFNNAAEIVISSEQHRTYVLIRSLWNIMKSIITNWPGKRRRNLKPWTSKRLDFVLKRIVFRAAKVVVINSIRWVGSSSSSDSASSASIASLISGEMGTVELRDFLAPDLKRSFLIQFWILPVWIPEFPPPCSQNHSDCK